MAYRTDFIRQAPVLTFLSWYGRMFPTYTGPLVADTGVCDGCVDN